MKYEYKTIQVDNKSRFMRSEIDTHRIDEILNSHAQTGWQLDQLSPITGSYGYAFYTLLILKREIQE